MTIVWLHSGDGSAYQEIKSQLSRAIFAGRADVPNGAIMAVLGGGEIKGAALFSWYSAGVVEVSMAAFARQWITRGAMVEMMDYAFGQLQAQAIMARTGSARVRRILGKMGLTGHSVPHIRAGKTETFFAMTAADWHASRFYKG